MLTIEHNIHRVDLSPTVMKDIQFLILFFHFSAFLFPFSCFLPFPIRSFLSLTLEVGPLKSSCKLPQAGSGSESQPKSNLVHLSFKIWWQRF